VDPAIAAIDDVVGVGWVDPHGVMIGVKVRSAFGLERFAAVFGVVKADAKNPDALVVIRVDSDVGEVHEAGIGVGHFGPGLALVVAAIESGLLRFHQGIDNVAVAAVDVETDAAEVFFREAFGELLPGGTAIGGAVDRTAWAAAIHAKGGAAALVGGSEDSVGIVDVHGDIVDAGVGIDRESLDPGLTAIDGFEYATFFVWPPEVTGGGYVDDVGVGGMDEDAPDVMGVFEAHVGPGLAAIR